MDLLHIIFQAQMYMKIVNWINSGNVDSAFFMVSN
jgi:hypothetical protein